MPERDRTREELLAWQDYLVSQIRWDERFYAGLIDQHMVTALAVTAFELIELGERGDGSPGE